LPPGRRPTGHGRRAGRLPDRDQAGADFGERFRVSFLQRRRDALAIIVDRARARGDLPPIPSPDVVADIVFGVIWYRVLSRHQPLDARLSGELVATLAGPETIQARPFAVTRYLPRLIAGVRSARPLPTRVRTAAAASAESRCIPLSATERTSSSWVIG
jgi:Tetracyclin repressor-like, C-terminal domain